MSLEKILAPEQILYFFTEAFERATESAKTEFMETIQQAIIQHPTANIDYASDVAIAWACLMTNSKDRPAMLHGPCTPQLTEAADTQTPLIAVAHAVKSGHTSVIDVSYLRYRLCLAYGNQLLSANAAAQSCMIDASHVKNFCRLVGRFAKDCTFRASGDWMIHTLTTLLCPAWSTALLEGGQAPYKLASELYGKEFNDMLRPTISTPLEELVQNALKPDAADTHLTFVVIATIVKELAPKTRIALNMDVVYHAKCTTPVLFYITDATIADVVSQSCYGFLLGGVLHVYNDHGIINLFIDWLLLMYLSDSSVTADLASFVFDTHNMSDANPLAKYR